VPELVKLHIPHIYHIVIVKNFSAANVVETVNWNYGLVSNWPKNSCVISVFG